MKKHHLKSCFCLLTRKSLFLAIIVTVVVFSACKFKQPVLSGSENHRLMVCGYEFRDLNKNGVLDGYEDWRLPAKIRADYLVAKMTLAEKAGAMQHINMDSDGTEAYTLDAITAFAGAGVSRRNDEISEYIEYVHRVQLAAEGTRLGIPFTISTDPRSHVGRSQYGVNLVQEGLTMWPQPAGFGAIALADEHKALKMLKAAGNVIRKEYRALGISVALHPQIDLPTEPRWGRIMGNFATEDAELTGKMGAAYIRGLQGWRIGSHSVAAMAKHFSGGGPQEDGIDAHLEAGKNQVYPGYNFDYHIIPFEYAVAEGVAAIMPYYGIPVDQTNEHVGMAFNEDIITGLLRNQLNYDGIVCTDWGIISEAPSLGGFIGMPWGVEDFTQAERIAKALSAGVDQFGGLDDPTPIIEAVNAGLVEESRLDISVKKLIKNKIKLGLFENPYPDALKTNSLAGKAQKLADKAQISSTVLLKNNCVLPVVTPRKSTVVYINGMTADEISALGVVGTENVAEADIAILRVSAPYSVVPGNEAANNSVFQMPGGPLVYGPYEGDSSDLSKYLIFDDDGNQVTDPANYHAVNYSDLELIQTAVANKGTNTRIVVDMYMGRAAILSEFIDNVDAMFASFGVTEENLLKLVFGEASPAGKMPFELPSSMAAVEEQAEDLPYDSVNPAFEYGFGLTY